MTGDDHIKWIKTDSERQRAHFLSFVGRSGRYRVINSWLKVEGNMSREQFALADAHGKTDQPIEHCHCGKVDGT